MPRAISARSRWTWSWSWGEDEIVVFATGKDYKENTLCLNKQGMEHINVLLYGLPPGIAGVPHGCLPEMRWPGAGGQLTFAPAFSSLLTIGLDNPA
jgi:hypothetical protein